MMSRRRRRALRKYDTSAKGRARTFRNNLYQRHGVRLPVTAELIASIAASQGNRCPITGKLLTEVSPAIDHAWDDTHNGVDAVRGLVARAVNPCLGRTDQDLQVFALNVGQYASRRARFLTKRACFGIRVLMGCTGRHRATP
jgi:hypothetical protein